MFNTKIAWLPIALALVFSVAFVAKLLTFDELSGVLAASGLVPQEFSKGGAVVLLLAEALLVSLLLAPQTRRIGFFSAAGLLSLFGAYHGWRLHEGIGVPCTCFGPLFKMSAPTGLAVCGGLLLLAHYGFVASTLKTVKTL